MKLSETPSKIIGVQIGEASLNFLKQGIPPIKAKFALITKEGEVCGFMEPEFSWSERAMEALQQFATVLEEEALLRIVEAGPEAQPTETPETAKEPPQF